MTDKMGNESQDNRLVAYSSLGIEKLLVVRDDEEGLNARSSPDSPKADNEDT